MGGFNSGRHGGKRTTGDMCALDIRRLARDGLLARGTAFLWPWSRGDEKVGSIQVWPVERDRVRLTYRTRDYGADDWKSMDYSVRVVWTDCALGGQRAWWLCPAVRCGRRVAVLYGDGVMPAAIATTWPTAPSANKPLTAQAARPTKSASVWAGRQAF